jgi:hypothetical protein
MPRKTRRQLVGKQEDDEREEREAELRILEWELHLAWVTDEEKSQDLEIQPMNQAESQLQAITLDLRFI